jgi:magnesium transporter
MLAPDKTRSLVEIEDFNSLKAELNSLPPVDVSEYIGDLPPEKQAILFRLLDKDSAIAVFEYLELDVQENLIDALHNTQISEIIEAMRPDDRVALFDELPAGVVKRLLQHLSMEERRATATLLGYPEGTAGRVMTTEYVRLQQGLTVGQALQKIQRSDRDKETIYYAYVTDENRKLLQVVSLRQLLFTLPDTPLKEVASNRVIKAYTLMSQEDVARVMKRYDLIALPVVDREDRLVGIITIDDTIDILEEEATEDMQKLAGVSGGDEEALSPPLVTIQKRLPWLMANIGFYIAAVSAIAPFQKTISLIPVLAVIMPILSNASGNVAIQALSVTVRGLGVGEVTPKDAAIVLRKEIVAGLANAIALGTAIGVLSLFLAPSHERWVASIAAVAMSINVLIAASLGTLLPLGLKKLSLDPALISGPILTSLLDAIGFLTFLSLISLVMAASGH